LLFFAWGCPAYNAQDFATLRTAWGAGSSPLLARTHLGLPDASASGNFRAGLNLVDGYYPWSTPGSAFSEPTSTDSELAPLIAANTHDFYYTGESMLAYRQRWVGYTKAFENDFPLRMGGVMGHGDNRPCGGWGSQVFYIARKDGATARAQWELYKNERNNLDAVFIATWNDWTEGTIVEPSVERGLQDVTIIEEGASGFKAVASDPTGLPLPKRLFDLRKGYAQLIRLGFPLAGCKARLNAVAEQVANRQFAAAESAIAQEEARLLSLQSQVVAQPPSVKTLVRYSADPPTTEYTATSSIPISLTLPSAMDVLMSTLRCDAELTWEWRDVDFGTYRIYTNNSGTAASDAIAEIIGSGTGQWKTAKIRVYDQNCWFTRDTNTNYGGAVLKVTGNVTFRNMVLTVTRKDLPPVIALGPVGGSVLTGESFSLSLEAGGTGGVTYQWRKNDVNIAGATSATYTIASAQTTDGGSYSVVVSNVAGSVTSGSVSLTVDKASPVIFTAPTASAITSGQALSFSVLSGGSASVAGIFAYTSPSTVPSVGTSSQSVTFTPTDVTRYNAVSTSANVTVNALVSPPAITSGTLVSGTVGAVFNYQISATNNPTSYSVTGLLSGLTVNASTGLVSGTPTTAGQTTVTLRATNSAGTGTATLTLNITQPVVQGVPVITNVDKAGGIVGGPFTYQITATNNPSSFSATGLPAGLSVNASSGLISGTLNAAGQFPITLTATNSTGVGNANLALIVSSGAINWLDLAGTYEGLLEKSPDSQADDGAAYRGAFSLTFNRIGTVSGRVFYNEATSLGTAPNRVYVPVTRTFVGRLDASSANPLVCRKVVRLGTGTSLGRQELTLEVSFAETPPRLNLSVKDTASPSAGEDAWVSQALSCTRSLTKLPTSTSAGGGTLDYSKAVGRYTLSATDGDPSGVNNAHVLAQLLSTGKLLWTSRMKGTFGTGSTGLRVTADELNASVYERRVSSTSTSLKSTSLLGSLNFVWDSASNSWGSNFGSETLPGKLEKQASYVSKTGGKLAFNDAQDSTGITELDFSNKDGVRWGNTTVTTVPAFLSGSTLTASPFTLNAQDPPDSDGNNASYTWNVSVTAAGRVLTTSTTDGTRRLSPRLLLTLNRQNGEFTGYYMTNISGKNVRRNIYGCGLMSQTDEALRARGWVESGVLPTLSTGGWTLQLGQ
jgi:hypothetical protein